MRNVASTLLLGVLLAPAAALAQGSAPAVPSQPPAGEPPKAAASTNEDALYSLGVLLSRDVRPLNLTSSELETVKRGLTDALTGKVQLDAPKHEQKVQAFASERLAATAQKNRDAGKSFVAAAAKEPGAQKTASGVVYRSLKDGTGVSPKETDTVKVKLVGKLTDGTVFDSGASGPTEFMMNQVFRCLSEGLAKMKVGGKAKLVCPAEAAFGDQGNPPAVPPGATLVFEVELLAARATPKTSKPPGHPMGRMPSGHP